MHCGTALYLIGPGVMTGANEIQLLPDQMQAVAVFTAKLTQLSVRRWQRQVS